MNIAEILSIPASEDMHIGLKKGEDFLEKVFLGEILKGLAP